MNWNSVTRSRVGCAVLSRVGKVAGAFPLSASPETVHAPLQKVVAPAVTLHNAMPMGKSFVIPEGVTSLEIFVAGASGGAGTTSLFVDNGSGGFGSALTGTLLVAAGDTVTFYGSCAGGPAGNNGAGGIAGTGYLDGGAGGSKATPSSTPNRAGGGGGGASAILVNGLPVIIAGGGGGGGGRGTQPGSAGGDGGNGTCQGGAGQFAGGPGGNAGQLNSGNQSLGVPCNLLAGGGGGGGGGGYSSGAGGQSAVSNGGGGGGGGGNFYTATLINPVVTTNRIAGGFVKLTYRAEPVIPTFRLSLEDL